MDSRLCRWLDKALAHKNRGEYRRAIHILKQALHEFPDAPTVHGLLGSVYYLAHQYPYAALSFRRATRVSPKSEKASLGLFHSLWKVGSIRQALRELRRFRAVASSSDYAEIEEAIRDADMDDRELQRALAEYSQTTMKP